MKNKKLLQSSIFLILLFYTASPAFSDQVRELSFDSWAESAGLYYFEDVAELCNYAGSFTVDSEDFRLFFMKMPEKAFLPWTEQVRVSGFTETNDMLTIGINKGYPLGLNINSAEAERFPGPDNKTIKNYLELSSGRTLGTMYSDDSSVYFHFYNDDLLGASAVKKVVPELSGTYILKFEKMVNKEASLSAKALNFADSESGWEPVELIDMQSGSLAAWKYSDEKKTRFRYLIHSEDGTAVKEVNEDYFRDGYPLIPFSEGPFALRGFIRAVRAGVLGGRLENTGEVFLRLSSADANGFADNYPAFFYEKAAGPLSGTASYPVILPTAGSGMFWFILSDNTIIRCGENIAVYRLPELPEGFKYEELWAGSGHLIVSWEETRFPLIGRSGMMYISMRDILNK